MILPLALLLAAAAPAGPADTRPDKARFDACVHLSDGDPTAAEKTAAELDADGPQITQAGTHNYQSATLAAGFDQHPRAWGTVHAVRFFAHALALPEAAAGKAARP